MELCKRKFVLVGSEQLKVMLNKIMMPDFLVTTPSFLKKQQKTTITFNIGIFINLHGLICHEIYHTTNAFVFVFILLPAC